ncbi:MAG: ROK family protein, partial [Sphingomonadaceae bacterium]|nr:ROK family protein [Sphingomonadaceae bacterium]
MNAAHNLPLVAGLELGGTKCVAMLARGNDILARESVPTTTPGEVLPALSNILAAWRTAQAIEAIGIACFGPIVLDPSDARFGRLFAATKTGWSDADVAGWFAARHDLPIALDTDVNAAALAERAWGAAQGCDTLAYVTIGTGIGVGMVVNGAPVHGLLHPEFGHLRVRRRAGDGFAGTCRFHGDCIEGLASGSSILARTGMRADKLPRDHPAVRDIVAELAELIAALVLAVSPERIVIGGSAGLALAEAGHLAAI